MLTEDPRQRISSAELVSELQPAMAAAPLDRLVKSSPSPKVDESEMTLDVPALDATRSSFTFSSKRGWMRLALKRSFGS
jgi:hypothetical protein